MPNILFASNNIAHWPTSVAGSVAGTYDDNRVPYSIAMSNFETLNSPVFTPSTTDETWFSFRVFSDSIQQLGNSPFIQAYNSDGTLLFSFRKTFNTSGFSLTGYLYDGSTQLTGVSSINFTQSKTSTIAVKYVVTALTIEVSLYVNGSLGLTLTFNANPNTYTKPVVFSIGCAFTLNLTDIQHISEIIVADGDCRNARFDMLRPLAAGAYGDWLGSLITLLDDDPTSGMTTTVANSRQTTTLTPYTGVPNISNFVIVSQTTRGQNAPTAISHTIRLSGVDYDSPPISVGSPLQYNITDYNINPATSLPWVGTDLSAIETGFISVA